MKMLWKPEKRALFKFFYWEWFEKHLTLLGVGSLEDFLKILQYLGILELQLLIRIIRKSSFAR